MVEVTSKIGSPQVPMGITPARSSKNPADVRPLDDANPPAVLASPNMFESAASKTGSPVRCRPAQKSSNRDQVVVPQENHHLNSMLNNIAAAFRGRVARSATKSVFPSTDGIEGKKSDSGAR